MSARAASAPGAGVLDRLQVLRSAPTPLRGAPAATWTPSPRTGVGPLRVPGPGLQPSSHDTTTTRTDPAGSTLARPDFGPKDGVHLTPGLESRRVHSGSYRWVWISLGAGLPGQGFEPVSEGEMTSHKETPSSLVFPASLRRWTRRIQANVALSLVTIPVSCCLRGRSRPISLWRMAQ